MQGLNNMANISKQEINFIKVIVRPLWVEVNNFMENSLKECIDNVSDNQIKWEKVLEDETKKNEEKK